jgi:hypothetical protein
VLTSNEVSQSQLGAMPEVHPLQYSDDPKSFMAPSGYRSPKICMRCALRSIAAAIRSAVSIS